MAFNSEQGKATYTASAGQTVFPFLFKIYVESDLKVYQTPSGNTPDDTADLLTLTTDYTVTINGDAGGEITLVSGAALNDTLILERELPVTRDIDYQTGGDLLANTLDADQDYQTYLVLDRQSREDRLLKLPSTDVNMSSSLPTSTANHGLFVNETGTAFEYRVGDEIGAALKAWESQAEAMTSESYATEAEDVFVKTYASDNDGTFTATDTTEYSALHWAAKSAASAAILLNVYQFGAVGDGVTDDTTAFTNAIAYAMTNNTTLKWSSGDFALSSWTTIPLTGSLKIVGDGIETTTVNGAGTEYLFSNIKEGLSIEGVSFKTFGAVFDEDIPNGEVVNITELIIKNNRFEDVAIPGRYRTYASDSADVIGENIHITGNYLVNCGYGFKIELNIFGYSVKNNVMKTIGLPYRTYARDTLGFSIARDVEGISMGRDSTVNNETTNTQGDGDISGNVIYDVTSDEAAAQNKVAKGIVAFGSGVSITDNKLRRITLTDADATNADGIYWKGSSFVIKGNNLLDAGYNEASIKGKGSATTVTSKDNIVSLNIISWTTQTRERQNGISVINGKCVISENIILYAIGNAIETSGDDVKVHDNEIKYVTCSPVTSTIVAKPINVKDGKNCKVNNNDIVIDGRNVGYVYAIANESTSASDPYPIESFEVIGNTISLASLMTSDDVTFTATGSIISSPDLDTTELTVGGKLSISGSVSNDGAFTVATITDATTFTTVEAIIGEAAGAVVTLTQDELTNAFVGVRVYERGHGIGVLNISGNTFTIRNSIRQIIAINLGILGGVRTGIFQNNTNDCQTSGSFTDISEDGTFTTLGWDNNTGFTTTPS